MSNSPTPLRHSIEVKVDDKTREVFMSFALLNRICYLMVDSGNIPLILQDPQLREAILVEALAVRDQKGKVIERKEIDEMSISFEDIQNILEFVSEHVADFTMAVVEKSQKVMQSRMDRINALKTPLSSTATSTGPESSVSKSPAA